MQIQIEKFRMNPDTGQSEQVSQEVAPHENLAKFTLDGRMVVQVTVSQENNTVFIRCTPRDNFFTRLKPAYAMLKLELGCTEVLENLVVSREFFKNKMQKVEQLFNIQEGDPDYAEWNLSLILHSPRFNDREEEKNGK